MYYWPPFLHHLQAPINLSIIKKHDDEKPFPLPLSANLVLSKNMFIKTN